MPCALFYYNSTEVLSFERDGNCVRYTTQSVASYYMITPSVVIIKYKNTISTHRVSVFPSPLIVHCVIAAYNAILCTSLFTPNQYLERLLIRIFFLRNFKSLLKIRVINNTNMANITLFSCYSIFFLLSVTIFHKFSDFYLLFVAS